MRSNETMAVLTSSAIAPESPVLVLLQSQRNYEALARAGCLSVCRFGMAIFKPFDFIHCSDVTKPGRTDDGISP